MNPVTGDFRENRCNDGGEVEEAWDIISFELVRYFEYGEGT